MLYHDNSSLVYVFINGHDRLETLDTLGVRLNEGRVTDAWSAIRLHSVKLNADRQIPTGCTTQKKMGTLFFKD